MLARAAEVAAAQNFVAFGAALAVVGLVLALLLWRRTLLAAGALAVLLGIAAATLVAPYVGEVMQGPTYRAAQFAKARSETIVLWHFPAPSFSAYLGRVTPARPPQPGELAFTRVGQIPPDVNVEVLFQQGGVVLVKRLP
jgi:xanthosine utilization system XapX-like protein